MTRIILTALFLSAIPIRADNLPLFPRDLRQVEVIITPTSHHNGVVWLPGCDEDELDTVEEVVYPLRPSLGYTGEDKLAAERQHPWPGSNAVCNLSASNGKRKQHCRQRLLKKFHAVEGIGLAVSSILLAQGQLADS